MTNLKKALFVYILLLIVCLDLSAGIEEISFSRKDASTGTAYVSSPENKDSFPLVVYIDGSFTQSVKNNFTVISFLFNQKNMGVLAIEKRGITKDKINEEEFLAYDCYENRLEDYIQLVSELELTNWNGQLVFIGSSEGGKIAPKLTLYFADRTSGTILIGSGGGLPFGEEIKYQIKQIAKENKIEFNETELEEQIDDQFTVMLNNPFSLEEYYEKTYQWFASYLKYDVLNDLVKIDTPILMIHGVLDTHIPVQSADLIKANFDSLGKENLTYFRSEDLGHSISKRADIFLMMLDFSAVHAFSEVPAAAAVRF